MNGFLSDSLLTTQRGTTTEPIQITNALIFSTTIVLVITRALNPVGFALLGVVAMVVAAA